MNKPLFSHPPITFSQYASHCISGDMHIPCLSSEPSENITYFSNINQVTKVAPGEPGVCSGCQSRTIPNIFSHSERCLFALFMVSFLVKNPLSLIGSQWFIFAFLFIILGGGSKKKQQINTKRSNRQKGSNRQKRSNRQKVQNKQLMELNIKIKSNQKMGGRPKQTSL